MHLFLLLRYLCEPTSHIKEGSPPLPFINVDVSPFLITLGLAPPPPPPALISIKLVSPNIVVPPGDAGITSPFATLAPFPPAPILIFIVCFSFLIFFYPPIKLKHLFF